MMDSVRLDLIVALAAGVGLAAASGFRVFVPLLGASLAARFGYLDPDPELAWVASSTATLVLGVAVVAELGAYLVPWLDNALDTVATPAALVAGTLLTAFALGDAPDGLQWVLAVVAGGGTAGVVQAGTVALRAGSLATTGGLGNPVVAVGEAMLSGLVTVLAVLVPLVAILIVPLVVVLWVHRRRARAAAPGG